MGRVTATDDIVAIESPPVRLRGRGEPTGPGPSWSRLFIADTLIRIDTVTRTAFELVGPAALGEFIGGAVERFAFFEFVRLNAHIELDHGGDPDAARCRLFMCEVRRDVDTLDWSVAYGVYHDRYDVDPRVALHAPGLPVAHTHRRRGLPLPAPSGWPDHGGNHPDRWIPSIGPDRRRTDHEPLQRGPADPGSRRRRSATTTGARRRLLRAAGPGRRPRSPAPPPGRSAGAHRRAPPVRRLGAVLRRLSAKKAAAESKGVTIQLIVAVTAAHIHVLNRATDGRLTDHVASFERGHLPGRGDTSSACQARHADRSRVRRRTATWWAASARSR